MAEISRINRGKPSPYDDINEFYGQIGEHWSRLVSLRQSLEERDAAFAFLEVVAFQLEMKGKSANAGPNETPTNAARAADRLVELASDVLTKSLPRRMQ